MRDDLHMPLYKTSEQAAAQEEDGYVENLILQHKERLDQITRYYRQGKMTGEQVKKLLEPKKG